MAEGALQYVKKQGSQGIESALASGEADINMHFAAPTIVRLDAGDPIVILTGGHIGCFELFRSEGVRALRDLQGKTVAVPVLGSSEHVFIARGARKVQEPQSGDLEEIVVELHDRLAVIAAIRSGDVALLSSAAAIALALLRSP